MISLTKDNGQPLIIYPFDILAMNRSPGDRLTHLWLKRGEITVKENVKQIKLLCKKDTKERQLELPLKRRKS